MCTKGSDVVPFGLAMDCLAKDLISCPQRNYMIRSPRAGFGCAALETSNSKTAKLILEHDLKPKKLVLHPRTSEPGTVCP